MAYADIVFKNLISEIMANGISDEGMDVRPKWSDGEPAHTRKIFGWVSRYDLSKEFPICTIRKQAFKSAIDEILWIWQKKSNNVKDLNSHIWDQWTDENGTIGKAYGYQLGIKHHYSDGDFDQVDRVLKDLKENPTSRRMVTSIYNHADLHEMGLSPCAWSMTFDVDWKHGRLNGILNQRSQDVLVANNWNVIQYAILLHMFAQVSGLKAGTLIHVIANAHIYDRHMDICKDLLSAAEFKAPQLIINPDVKDFYDFTVNDFKLRNYRYDKNITKIPVAE